jgi:hypothetical protein
MKAIARYQRSSFGLTYLGESELLVGHELDCGLVDIASTVVILGVYLFESSILKPYCRSVLRRK